jgi:hypothetical protein
MVDENDGSKTGMSPGSLDGETADWRRIGYFGTCELFAQGNLRRVINPETGNIIAQYRVNDLAGDNPNSTFK